MKQLVAVLLLLLSAQLLAQTAQTPAPSSPPAAPATATAQESAPVQEDVRKILADRIDLYKKSVGMVVGVITPQGTKIYSYGKLATDNPATPNGDTVYEIGSMTKVFTSLILADMVRHGEVRLDDPVAKYLPPTVKVPERNGKKITLVDLATHTSGLPRMPNNFHPKDETNPYADYTPEQLYEFLSGYELTRDIGSKYEYSNLGAGLLGYALSLRAGTTWENLVQTRVLRPLKMTSSAVSLTPELRARLAHGYDPMLNPAANWDIATLTGAGGLRSTANDVLKFLAANMGLEQTPLLPAMKSMLDVRRPSGNPNLEIALAWHIFKQNGNEAIWHNGGTGGYHSFMGFDPAKKIGVVVLSNSQNDIDDIGRHILDPQVQLVKLSVTKKHEEVKVDPKLFDAYVGHYELAPGAVMEITHKPDGLFAQLTNQPQFQIFPESETDFFWKIVDAQVTFEKGSDGKVSKLVLHQNGRDLPGRKVD